MSDYNPDDTVTLAELEQLRGADEVRRLYERIKLNRWRAQCEALLARMREVVEELQILEPTTVDTRPRWFALQEEFTELSALLDAAYGESDSAPPAPADTTCRWCGKPYDEHLDARPPGAPQPRMPCLGLKASFLARTAAQAASAESNACVACALTAGGVCPDHGSAPAT